MPEEIKTTSTENEILTYLKGGTPYLWINTKEGIRVQKDIINHFASIDAKYKIFSWDAERGMVSIGDKVEKVPMPPGTDFRSEDPYAAILITRGLNEKVKSVTFVHNMHSYIRDMLLMQIMLNSINDLKSKAHHVIFLCPTDEIPVEVRDYITLLKYPLPDEGRIEKIIDIQLNSLKSKYPERYEKINRDYTKNKNNIISQARGLTAYSVEQAITQSLVINNRITADKIFEEKRQMVAKSAALDFISPKTGFKDVGGLDRLKTFIQREIKDPTKFPRPKGALLLGVPGCGKSLIVKAAGLEAGLPVLSFDFAKVYKGIVGESETTMANVVQVIDAVSPCIVIVDEIEKGLSGVASSAKTDGGVGDKVGSIWLKWMSDHESPAIIFGTCNSVNKLPAEYLRAGRWDAIFFVDLPNALERQQIIKIHMEKYGINQKQEMPDFKNYTGAEIEQMCITSARFEIPLKEAMGYVVPLYRSMREEVDGLRTWAKDRTLLASTPDEEQENLAAYQAGEGRAVDFLDEE